MNKVNLYYDDYGDNKFISGRIIYVLNIISKLTVMSCISKSLVLSKVLMIIIHKCMLSLGYFKIVCFQCTDTYEDGIYFMIIAPPYEK